MDIPNSEGIPTWKRELVGHLKYCAIPRLVLCSVWIYIYLLSLCFDPFAFCLVVFSAFLSQFTLVLPPLLVYVHGVHQYYGCLQLIQLVPVAIWWYI